MELALNLLWLAIALAAFLFVPRRDVRVLVAVALILAVLFPIISPSDDINAIQTLNDAAATLVVIMELVVAFFAIERLRAMRMRAFTVHVATPTDPRSPPAR